LGYAPELDMDAMLDMVSVDYVAKSAVYISMQKDSIGKVFHVTSPLLFQVSWWCCGCFLLIGMVVCVCWDDYVAKSAVYISMQKDSIGKVFHVTSPLLFQVSWWCCGCFLLIGMVEMFVEMFVYQLLMWYFIFHVVCNASQQQQQQQQQQCNT